MPLYDVHCSRYPNCSYHDEYLTKKGDVENVPCPRCKEGHLVRDEIQVFSTPSSRRSAIKGGQKLIEVSTTGIPVDIKGVDFSLSGKLHLATVHRPEEN